jgi:hypothetical protein
LKKPMFFADPSTRRRRKQPTSLVALVGVFVPSAAQAQDGSLRETISVGTAIGTGFLAVMATLVGLSVVAKLLLVLRIVPQTPENRFQRAVHALAGIVARLRITPDIRARRRRF